ncbi:Regulator of G protein signaling superfamily [Cordyceps javanica]|nr:Regulator of G protein signaling superfamily [Cordyceps javanica]
MWLISLYVPAMEAVNKYFIPPQWICLSIIFMEIFTIFVPCWDVLRYQSLHKETLDCIAQWEAQNRNRGVKDAKSLISSDDSTIVDSILTGKKSAAGSVGSTSNESILTMSALEYVLERNPAPLQQYSALRDFSGENIAFLTSVSEWKNSFPSSIRNAQHPSSDINMRELVRERFNRAVRIYAQFVSTRDAEFPINISSVQQKRLEAVFEGPTRALYGEKRPLDSATPFGAQWEKSTPVESASESPSSEISGTEDRVQYWGDVPDEFNETIFDDAEKSIKYLVLTNTWPKFVRDRRASLDADEDVETGNHAIRLDRERHNRQ